MSDKTVVDLVKEKVGFKTVVPTCSNCEYIKVDPTMDEHSVGDQCIRNPDVNFKVSKDTVCDRHIPKDPTAK